MKMVSVVESDTIGKPLIRELGIRSGDPELALGEIAASFNPVIT
jgi:hypothetical protein